MKPAGAVEVITACDLAIFPFRTALTVLGYHENAIYELVCHTETFDVAHDILANTKLLLSLKVHFRITGDPDEWYLTKHVYDKDKKLIENKTVWSPGA